MAPRSDRATLFAAIFALIALGCICALAFFCPSEKVVLADKVGFVLLSVATCSLLTKRGVTMLSAQPGSDSFALTATMFVIYAVARRAVPENGPSLHLSILPDDQFTFSYAAYFAVLGALCVSPFTGRRRHDSTLATLGAIGVLAFFALFSCWLLGQYYPVGPTKVLDPSRLPELGLMLIEYCGVALLCRTVCLHDVTRRIALSALPVLMLALWACFHFANPAEESA